MFWKTRQVYFGLSCLALTFTSGCASLSLPTTARTTAPASNSAAYDPLETVNRAVFKFNNGADKYVIGPTTSAYKKVLPNPIRKGIGNAARNLGEPVTFVNHVLQLDVKDALNSLGRFMLNSTAGLAGFIDLAEKNGVPQDKEDFGQTLATYGVPQGPYLVLPLLGTSSLRGLTGRAADGAANSVLLSEIPSDSAVRAGRVVANGLERRISAEPFLENLSQSADPYVSLRSAYTQNRLSNIHEDADAFTAPSTFDDEGDYTDGFADFE